MKKILAITLTVLTLFGTMSTNALAEEATEANVYVTISDKEGKLALTQEKITVTDVDSDGALTINDVLYAAHEAKYEGGAAVGYASSMGDYGLKLDKLWGTANGTGYGYYVNNKSAISLTDTVKEGDYINAYVYTDLTAWSDTYCYFDVNKAWVTAGREITVTLSAAGYDASWNPVVIPVEGATITVNGEKTEFKTDKDGKVTFALSKAGNYVISAVSDTMTLVPPVCQVAVEEVAPPTEDNANIYMSITLLAVSFAGVMAFTVKSKKAYEK